MSLIVGGVGPRPGVSATQGASAQAAVTAATNKISGISSQIAALNQALATIQEALAILEQEKSALKPPNESKYWRTEQRTEDGVTKSVRVFDSARFNADMSTYLSALHRIESQITALEAQARAIEQQLAQKERELADATAELEKAQRDLEAALKNDAEALLAAQKRYEEAQRQAQEAREQLMQAQANAQRAQDALEQAENSIKEAYDTAAEMAGIPEDEREEFHEEVAAWEPGDPPVFRVAEPVDTAKLTQGSKDLAAADLALQTHLQNATGVLPRLEDGKLMPPLVPLTAESYCELLPRLASFENGLHNTDAGLLLEPGANEAAAINSASGAQLVNAWLAAGFSMEVATTALEAMVGAVRAGEILSAVALTFNPENGPLADRNLNQFIPDEVLESGDPALVHQYITESNTAAYQDDIDIKNQELADARAGGADPADIAALEAEVTNLEAQRDLQTQDAIAQFDAYYDDALARIEVDPTTRILSKEAQQKLAVADAGAAYNDWVFFYNSEGKPPVGPVTLYATGVGDGWPIELNDINQDGLGDCYFMASLAAIAQSRPELIERMINDNGDGTYTVTFHEEVPDDSFIGRLLGRTKVVEVEVTVDLDLPSNGRVAGPTGDVDDTGAAEVWPLVLEKAWAQYHGSYGAIEGGFPGDVLFAVTGDKTTFVVPDDYTADEIADDLADNKAVVMDSVGIAEEDKHLLATYDLVEGHAYTVKDIRTDADGNQYVTLFNPWGVGNEPKPIPYEDAVKLFGQMWVN